MSKNGKEQSSFCISSQSSVSSISQWSPSTSASSRNLSHCSITNDDGRRKLNQRLRSVLCHPLGLPLLYSLHGKDPTTLPVGLNRTERQFTEHATTVMDGLLRTSVNEWLKLEVRTKPQLINSLVEKIDKLYNDTAFHADGEVDLLYEIDSYYEEALQNTTTRQMGILLSSEKNGIQDPLHHSGTTPYALIEMGRNDSDWWAKLDQNLKYIDQLGKTQLDARLNFDAPLLCVIQTLQPDAETSDLQMKLGVFLCVPRKNGDKCRVTVLWNLSTRDLDEASRAFGRMLRVTSNFALWRNCVSNDASTYTNLSSNCCRVGGKILRSYDNRYRKTNRSPEVYLDKECVSIVGGEVKIILKIPEQESNDDEFDCFFNKTRDRGLLVIEVPYKEGSHVAKSATDFLPVIEQLQQLHALGYVHGDIRAFNTVFNGKDGGLIDFDFSGKPGTPYPKGYQSHLSDGDRIGSAGGRERAFNTLQYWHDWRALHNLMFRIHTFYVIVKKDPIPDLNISFVLRLSDLQCQGSDMVSNLSPEKLEKFVEDLVQLMKDFEENNFNPKPALSFRTMLERIATSLGTQVGATGSTTEIL